MNSNPFSEISSLIEMLEKGQESNFPHAHANKPYCERFKELDNYFSGYDVEMGALQNEIIDSKNFFLDFSDLIVSSLVIEFPFLKTFDSCTLMKNRCRNFITI